MAHAKLDMGKAWTQTTALIGANKDTLSALAGLFFFLPAFGAALFLPEATTTIPAGGQRQSGDPQVAMQQALDQISALYADNWPFLLAVSIAGSTGAAQTSYLAEYNALGTEIASALSGATFDGVNLFSANAAAITVQTGPSTTYTLKAIAGAATSVAWRGVGGAGGM